MINLLTFDIEEWFHANYDVVDLLGKFGEDERLKFNTQRFLSLCERHNARATFFILARTAEKYPDIVLMIKEKGHEIATHGYSHVLVYKQSPEEFEEDLKRSIDVLQGITGEKIVGYRAPSWSSYQNFDWFFRILERNEIIYDSSIFPMKTFLYGDRYAERFPYRINNIIEIPATTLNLLGMRVPFSGGFYLRFFPYSFIKMGIKNLNKQNQPAMIYLHPREIDDLTPKLDLPFKERFIHYVNLKTAEKKLDRLLESFKFSSIKDYLNI
ncbi:MAG: polysaccharide deacetylase family protein [Acidobacteriota bacterium]